MKTTSNQDRRLTEWLVDWVGWHYAFSNDTGKCIGKVMVPTSHVEDRLMRETKKDEQYKKGRRDKMPRPDDILRKGGPMKDRTKYTRKRKHKGDVDE